MHYLDLATIALYLIAITWFGAHFRKSQRSLKDYFLGGRNAPWWAIALSIVSAETSTLTVIGTPALSFSGNFEFLQLVLGYLLARIVISALFLPQYFRGEMFTAYELMRRRFGERIRRLTAGTFLVLRALAEGVRVFALSIVIAIVLGTGEIVSILVIVCLTLFYTFEGGMTAVIWTDAVQMFLYVGGAILSFWVILQQIPGGWPHVAALAGEAHKFQMFDFRFAWTPEFFSRSYSFWAGLIGGTFFTTASHGTDQLIVQRLLAARGQKQSATALISSGFAIFFQFALFLLVGVMLWAYYRVPSATFGKPDRIYPTFIATRLPHGISGLLIAAILAAAMSNLSAALNSLSSSAIMDFYARFRPQSDEKTKMRVSRLATLVWALILFGLAVIALHRAGRVVEAGLQIASVAYGAMLGAFLLGALTRRANQFGTMVGMLCGFALELYLWLGTHVPWTWWVTLGTSVTFIVGIGVSALEAKRQSA